MKAEISLCLDAFRKNGCGSQSGAGGRSPSLPQRFLLSPSRRSQAEPILVAEDTQANHIGDTQPHPALTTGAHLKAVEDALKGAGLSAATDAEHIRAKQDLETWDAAERGSSRSPKPGPQAPPRAVSAGSSNGSSGLGGSLLPTTRSTQCPMLFCEGPRQREPDKTGGAPRARSLGIAAFQRSSKTLASPSQPAPPPWPAQRQQQQQQQQQQP